MDSFQVITITADGKKRIYLAFIDETQKGAVTLLSESDSNEPTGTTIAIPLKEEQDKKLFWSECHEVSNYWDVKPIILDDMGMEYICLKAAEGCQPSRDQVSCSWRCKWPGRNSTVKRPPG